MSILSYRCTEENGLSFELLVDGESLGQLVGARDTAFPYWIEEDGLPRPYVVTDDPDARIVCVCHCGEYGCSHTGCRVTREGAEVVFNEFDFDVTSAGAKKLFRFAAANYDAVCEDIAQLAQQQRDRVSGPRR